jgi:putative addiction module killer protein
VVRGCISRHLRLDNLYSFEYNLDTFIVRQLPEFEHWLKNLREKTTRIRLARRLEKAQRGNLGETRPVGNGVFEMREVFGPGYRMYYI